MTQSAVKEIKQVVVLTGAGISAESGIATFRGTDGLWEGHRIEDVATPEAFRHNPALVHKFYNMRRATLMAPQIQPNAAHKALADFEKNFPGTFVLVTQNVDDLHERAGSKRILHMHGELLKMRDVKSGEVSHWEDAFEATDSAQLQAKRPHIVWFGEMPLYMEEIEQALRSCDLFIAIGTSGQVYPAAGFVNWAPTRCLRVEINLDPTPVEHCFDQCIRAKATEAVPQFLENVLKGRV